MVCWDISFEMQRIYSKKGGDEVRNPEHNIEHTPNKGRNIQKDMTKE
jgi:hypothetical protein